jgi:WD40 repeat protein
MSTVASRALTVAAVALCASSTPARAQLDTIWSHAGHGRAVAFSPAGDTLANGGGGLDLYDAATGATVLTLDARFNDARSVAFSPSGALIADGVFSFNQNLNLWSLPDGAIVHERVTAHSNGTESVAFSPDGSLLATSGRDGWAKFWSVPDLTQVASVPSGRRTFSVAFSPDGVLLATGGQFGVAIWRVADASLVRWLDNGQSDFSSVAFSPDGSVLAAAASCTPDLNGNCTGGQIRLWNAADGALLRTLTVPGTDGTYSVAFSPDGRTLLSGGDAGAYDPFTSQPAYYGVLRLWRTADGALLHEFTQDIGDGSSAVMSVVFSPSGALLAFCRFDALVTVARTPGTVETCSADMNGDGSLNIQDFLAFLTAYAAGSPQADFTGDSLITIADFLSFLSAFAAGC